jgi:hypothetical protein
VPVTDGIDEIQTERSPHQLEGMALRSSYAHRGPPKLAAERSPLAPARNLIIPLDRLREEAYSVTSIKRV